MKKPIGVSLLTKYLSNSFKEDPLLYNILIEGEIINLSKKKYIYFDLKENQDLISCIYFTNDLEVSEGDRVVLEASISIYGPKSKYQLIVQKINIEGLGSGLLNILELKDKLDKKGYFNLDKKKKIKSFPLNIGLVTSLDSAAIKDFFKVLDDYQYIGKIYTFNTLVQGNFAENSILNAIKIADGMNLDVIVLTRGGGSNEDLSVFNSEKIADAVYNASTPILSAVGHEKDLTIVDLVSDLRASTPTKAAEVIAFNFKNIRKNIFEKRRLNKIFLVNMLDSYKSRASLAKATILSFDPIVRIEKIKERVVYLNIKNRARIKAHIDHIYRRLNEINLCNHKENEVFLQSRKILLKDSLGNIIELDKVEKDSIYIIESEKKKFKILILEEVYEQ